MDITPELEALITGIVRAELHRVLPAAQGPVADDVAAFLATRPPREVVRARELHEAFLAWARGAGVPPRTEAAFGRAMTRAGAYRRVRRFDGNYWER